MRIYLKTYDHRILDKSARKIIETVKKVNGEVAGPIPLPTEIKKFCVLRSPFIDKDSREQFEMRTHKRIIYIINPSPKIIDALMKLDLPSGLNIEIK